MKLFILLAGLAWGSVGLAVETVVLDGETHYTGLLRKSAKDKGVGVTYFSPTVADLPDAYDSRDLGIVTDIKNQGSCGSCWSFARTRAFETALIKAGKGPLAALDLAEQDALVNDKSGYGCNGGFMDGDFEVEQGTTTEAVCRYTADHKACASAGKKFGKALRWAMVGASNRAPTDDELRAAIYQYGTLAVTVAAGSSFDADANGNMRGCGGRGINHMVTLSGYKKGSDGKWYYLVGNSWGKSWGAGGYAWSTKGCNQLASSAGDAALFYYVGESPEPGPSPDPVPPGPAALGLPIEVILARGNEVRLTVRPKDGYTYTWTPGGAGTYVWVKPSGSTTVTLKAKAKDGSVTEQAVKLTVK